MATEIAVGIHIDRWQLSSKILTPLISLLQLWPVFMSARWEFTVGKGINKKVVPQRVDSYTSQWRHNGCDIVSNHQYHGCLLNRLFRCRSKKHQSSVIFILLQYILHYERVVPAVFQILCNGNVMHGKYWHIYPTQKRKCYLQTKQNYPLRILLKTTYILHDDVIKWKHFPRYWPLVRGIHRSRCIYHAWRFHCIIFEKRRELLFHNVECIEVGWKSITMMSNKFSIIRSRNDNCCVIGKTRTICGVHYTSTNVYQSFPIWWVICTYSVWA